MHFACPLFQIMSQLAIIEGLHLSRIHLAVSDCIFAFKIVPDMYVQKYVYGEQPVGSPTLLSARARPSILKDGHSERAEIHPRTTAGDEESGSTTMAERMTSVVSHWGVGWMGGRVP